LTNEKAVEKVHIPDFWTDADGLIMSLNLPGFSLYAKAALQKLDAWPLKKADSSSEKKHQ